MAVTTLSIHQRPDRLFEYILYHYFRQHPPYIANCNRQFLDRQPLRIRKYLAEACDTPELIELLVEDPDSSVSHAARKNNYWQYVGQYRQLLQMRRQDKIRFIENEPFASLPVFIIFEKDPEVLEAVFLNPNLSIQMLVMLKSMLKKRGRYTEDQRLQAIIDQVIQLKSSRIHKISAIINAAQAKEQGNPAALFLALIDKDPMVVRSARSALREFPVEKIITTLYRHPDLNRLPDAASTVFWQILDRLSEYGRQFPGFLHFNKVPDGQPLPPAHFHEKLIEARLRLIRHCLMHLDRQHSLTTVASAHCHADRHIRDYMAMALPIEDLLEIVSDSHYPPESAFKVLDILHRHHSAAVRQRVDEVMVVLTNQHQRSFEEMESSITACFDIIFSDLSRTMKERWESNKLPVPELEYLHELIEQVQKLPEQFLLYPVRFQSGSSPGYQRELQRGRLFWRATLGQYLGRLKQLSGFIQGQLGRVLAGEFSAGEIRQDFYQASRNLEKDYKEKISCQLMIHCSDCLKRTCAAERYLSEVKFFLEEMLDYIANNSREQKKMPI